MQKDVLQSEGGTAHVFSPQESPCKAPRSPRSPCTAAHTRSHSDSEATLEEKGAMGRPRPFEGHRPPESLFLDALFLDPLSEAVPPPSRLESEKRFPHLKEVRDRVRHQYILHNRKKKFLRSTINRFLLFLSFIIKYAVFAAVKEFCMYLTYYDWLTYLHVK